MTKRIFIAIELPPRIKNNLITLRNYFQNLKAKWVKPEHMHLTLIFLGDTDEKRIMEIQNICNKVAREFEPFTIDFVSLGAFPNSRRPHTLWVGVKVSEKLNHLQKRLTEELIKNGFRLEERVFTPHLTVARLKKRKNLKGLIEKFTKVNFGMVQVEGFNIFESELFPEGPKHKIMKNIKLT